MPVPEKILYEEPRVAYYQSCGMWRDQNEEIQYLQDISIVATSTSPCELTLEERFMQLALNWKSETRGYSITSQKYAHPAYKAILALVKSALPFILDDLKANGGRWFDALKSLSGRTDIAKVSHSYDDAVKAWLAWGRENNLIR